MNDQDRHNLFSDLVACYHSQLYAYVFAVVKNRQDAEDLVQSVCLVLWRKFDLFQPGTSFFSWARQTAKLMVCNFLRHKKNLSTAASEELLDALAESVSIIQDDGMEIHIAALRRCKEKLTAEDEDLLRLRYVEDLGIREIAARLGRLEPSVCRSLNRIRRWLFECIQVQVDRRSHSGRELQ
jgi:RNA polymerase sigma-70 factor, ECF subfamily